MSPDEPSGESPQPIPVMRMEDRRGHTRFLLLAGAALLVLILARIATSHPLPTPSHRSAEAAVAGYLDGLEHRNTGQVRRYLAPDRRSRAASLVRDLANQHTFISAPAAASVSQGQRRATVEISVEVCSPIPGHRGDSCVPVSHEPLGLPDELACVKVKGGWYVTTLFKPA
ncbi:MAG: hypothetical protein ACREN1_09245 [Candidatus Dormibacteria bacterium]